jgi:hypothetical protein
MRLAMTVAALVFLTACEERPEYKTHWRMYADADKKRTERSIEDCRAAGGVPRTEVSYDNTSAYYEKYEGCDFPPPRPMVVNPEAK